MSEIDSAPEAKRKRGRPAKVRRHDPVDAPVDGDPGADVVLNKEPGYRYILASDEDMPKLYHRGATRCERGSEQAKPVFDVRAESGDAHFDVKGLTLMKITEELAAKAEKPGLDMANRRMAGLRKTATARLGDGSLASVSEHEYRVNGS